MQQDYRFDLHRFVDAQDRVFVHVRAELEAGWKRTHWMWFIFPQLAGLGRSAMSMKYAISSADEARAYLAHPLHAERLRECTRFINRIEGWTAEKIFGPVDAIKFRSSMTFREVCGGE